MQKRGIVGLVLAGAWLFFPHLAAADELRQALRDFGLLGKWAMRCAQPANIDVGNAHATYSMIASNRAELRYNYGPKYSHRVYTITGARPQADGLLLEVYDNGDGIRSKMVIRKVQGKIQTFSNQEVTGKVWIQKGINTHDGKLATWLEPCAGPQVR